MYDDMRSDRGRGLPDWPAWCWCPLAGAYAIASRGLALPTSQAGEVAILGALGPWRAGQGIYRYDPDIYQALLETPLDQALPWDALYRLPEWCLYLETPGLSWEGQLIHGAYVHLEHDPNDCRAELRLLLDLPSVLLPVPIHMIPGASIAQGLEAMEMEAIGQAARLGLSIGPDPILRDNHLRAIQQIVSLAIYTCASEADLGTPAPIKAQPIRTRRHGLRTYPPDHPTIRLVGVTLGDQLRQARQQVEQQGGSHTGPRPHLRRAHWHSYWIGPRAGGPDRHLDLRWILPILVNPTEALDDPGSHPPSA